MASEQRVLGRNLAEHNIEALQIINRAWRGDEAVPSYGKDELFRFAALLERFIASGLRVHISHILQIIHDSTDNLLLPLVELLLVLEDYNNPVFLDEEYEEYEEKDLSQNKSLDHNVDRLDAVIALATRMRVNLRPFDKYCEVCLENHRADQFPQSPITSACRHEPNICLVATAAHLDTKLEDWPFSRLTCPLCPEELDADDMQRLVDEETFLRYSDLAFQEYLRSDPDFHNCLAGGCTSGQIHFDHPRGMPGQMRCNACGRPTCIRHGILWHVDLSCEQYDEHLRLDAQLEEDNAASAATIAATTKTCPEPDCQVSIEKNGGCDHVECRKCGHEFCWQCLAPYAGITTQGWRGHEPSCPYHNPGFPSTALLFPNQYLMLTVGDIDVDNETGEEGDEVDSDVDE